MNPLTLYLTPPPQLPSSPPSITRHPPLPIINTPCTHNRPPLPPPTHPPTHPQEDLLPGHAIHGPAIIVQNVATVVIEPLCTARIAEGGDIEITVEEVEQKVVTADLDPIYLSIFSHRFMGIAEQVGGGSVQSTARHCTALHCTALHFMWR